MQLLTKFWLLSGAMSVAVALRAISESMVHAYVRSHPLIDIGYRPRQMLADWFCWYPNGFGFVFDSLVDFVRAIHILLTSPSFKPIRFWTLLWLVGSIGMATLPIVTILFLSRLASWP